MKKIFRLSLTATALMFVFSIFAATETKAQGPLNEILKRMEAHRQSLTSLQAAIAMDKFNVQIGEHDVTEGTVLYLPAKGRDALVRIDWTRPVQETLASVNGKYVIYRPRLNQAITGNAKDAKGNGKANNALSFMNMSKEQLKANYNVQYLGQEAVSNGTQTWHLKMTPKAAANYQSGEMWVDGNGMPVQMKVTEKNGDTTTVLLSNLQKNISIKADQFNVKLPKGTQVVKG